MAVRKVAKKTPREKKPSVVEELQTVGADIVPTVPIEVRGRASRPHASGILRDATRPAETAGQSGRDALPSDTLLSDWDLHLFNEGTHTKLWQKLGNHIVPGGVMFGVWAPNAACVSVVGDFNDWNTGSHPLQARDASGIWEGFIPGLKRGATYKYHIVSRFNDYRVNKADPMAVHQETPPATASKYGISNIRGTTGSGCARAASETAMKHQ